MILRLFSFARLPNGAPLIIPSFELVKYKYDPESNPGRDPRDNPHSVMYYLLPVSIYIVLTALGFRMAFMPDVKPLPNYFVFPISIPDNLTLEALPFLGALSYTFIGLIFGLSNISFGGFPILIWPRSHFSNRSGIFYSPPSQWPQSGKAGSWRKSVRTH
jgi:hypothetical protein